MVLQCNCVITCISILDYFYLYKKMMPFDVLRVILWNLFHKITLPPIHGIKPHRFTLCTYGAYPFARGPFCFERLDQCLVSNYFTNTILDSTSPTAILKL